MNSWGVYFLGFVGKYGYDRILKVSIGHLLAAIPVASLCVHCMLIVLHANVCVCQVLGRHVRDFVNGLDNLHEYLRFSYPKVQPPTFFCQEESATGVTLHYRWERSVREYSSRVKAAIKNQE